jgi:hypothetical protein
LDTFSSLGWELQSGIVCWFRGATDLPLAAFAYYGSPLGCLCMLRTFPWLTICAADCPLTVLRSRGPPSCCCGCHGPIFPPQCAAAVCCKGAVTSITLILSVVVCVEGVTAS